MKLTRDGYIHIVLSISTEDAMRKYNRLCSIAECLWAYVTLEPFDRATIRARFEDNQQSRAIIKELGL